MYGMFDSAVIKLTAWYICVLMLVSLLFSLPLFILTSDRLERSAMRQTQILRDNPRVQDGMMQLEGLDALRENQLNLDRQQLLNNIILENLLVLVLGAIASYLFARRTLRPIEEAHTAQGKFTANASHQLRTPLATMQAEIDVALRDKKLSASQAREVLQSNLEEIARLRALSDQLLKLTHGDESGAHKSFDVVTVLKRFATKNKKQYNLIFTSSLKPKALVVGEAVLFEEALKVLCENATQYSGGKEVDMKVVSGRGCIRASVIDKGPGMSPAEQARIFDRFYRGKDSSSINPSGHGLGLALAREIVERYDGSISVKSKLGAGSTFTISLPLAIS